MARVGPDSATFWDVLLMSGKEFLGYFAALAVGFSLMLGFVKIVLPELVRWILLIAFLGML